MSKTRFGRGQKAMAIVPLAVLSAAWTASIAGAGASSASADSDPVHRLPDGTAVPTEAIEAPASVSASGGVAPGVGGQTARAIATASTSGIPAAALAAYQRAESVINAADKSCNLSWQLVAAIGRVESDHGRTNGNSLDADGVAQPGIYGIALDGSNGTMRITDTDAGQYDDDAKYDRAIGPMQFIPSTWSVVGVDADGDGERNPQDIDDAALATAVYLCSGDDDLSSVSGQRASVYRYNHSSSYVDLVMSIYNAYLEGEFTSVPNGTTSAGYLLPSEPAPQQHGGTKPPKHPNPGGNAGTDDGAEQPDAQPDEPPAEEPTPPSNPGGDGSTVGGGHGLPVPTLPPLPSTSVEPVDELLTHAQAVAQCTLEGYVDNILRDDDPFDRCVDDYTRR
ncbi:lytic transglycosylase domain-containing protein [Nocardioides pyridinolyticus]